MENQVEMEEKTRLINQVLELQHTLEGMGHSHNYNNTTTTTQQQNCCLTVTSDVVHMLRIPS